MSYFVSFPKPPPEKIRFFLVVSLGPLNHIVRNITLITIELVWLKFILSCLLHKNYKLTDEENVNEMMLNPNFGAYNRVLVWAFEYATKNIDPPTGVLLGSRWNYGTKAREKNRDFFDYTAFGRFLKDILDAQDPRNFLSNTKKYAEGNISEVTKEFLFLEQRFQQRVLGVNLSKFHVRDFLRDVFKRMRPEHFTTKRKEFVSNFVSSFVEVFRQTSDIEESGTITEHMLHQYIGFITRELDIIEKKDLLAKFRRDEKSLSEVFPDPSRLEPSLSDEGFDAFLILQLINESTKEHFHSFIISSYLKKKDVNFQFDYLDIYNRLKTKDFLAHIKKVESALSNFGKELMPLRLDKDLLRFLAIWWEYYQFSFIGEKVTRTIHRLLSYDYKPNEIRKNVSDRDLEILAQFLDTYSSNSQDYVDALRKDENYEQILVQLEEIGELGVKPTLGSIYRYLFDKACSQSSEEPQSNPFFPSLDSFELWVDKLTEVLHIK